MPSGCRVRTVVAAAIIIVLFVMLYLPLFPALAFGCYDHRSKCIIFTIIVWFRVLGKRARLVMVLLFNNYQAMNKWVLRRIVDLSII